MDAGEALDRLAEALAGEICLAENDPGAIMRRWRERFQFSQKDLAKHLEVSPSVISDYESGRRKSPRVETIRRFVGRTHLGSCYCGRWSGGSDS